MKKTVIWIFGIALVGLIIFGIFKFVNGGTDTFLNEANQSDSYDMALQKFSSEKEKRTIVLVFYKEGCKVCQRRQGELIPKFRNLVQKGVRVSYLEVTDGVPGDLFNSINDPNGVLNKFKTPYAIVVTSDDKSNGKYNIAYNLRLNTDKNINNFFNNFE
jgi:hypothetical protein